MDAPTKPATPTSQSSADFGLMVEKAREASNFLKALSHESRLLLLCALSEGECSVGELENILGERQSTVSQQLARLRLDRLVSTRRDGKTIYYSLADENVRAILEALRKAFCAPAEAEGKSKADGKAKARTARR
ncbi:MAG: metalloregulator ArsR/SmtB family transcription factor [Rhodoblastus sp.]